MTTAPADREPRFTALVLAGERPGGDPLARACGEAAKCLVRVAGVPMLVRVLEALAASPRIGALVVSIGEPAVIADLDAVRGLRAAGRLAVVRSAATPSRSVGAAAAALAEPFPLLVTTADHPLLTPAIVDWFCEAAVRASADVVAALTPATVLARAYPEAARTFLRFRDERYTGSNLFAISTPAGMAAVDFWRRVEGLRKRPWRLIGAFGVLPLVRYGLGRLTLADAMAIASRRIEARVDAVVSPFAEAGIDVDKPADLALVERILALDRRDR